jgi:hypothetical protein
MARKAIKWTLLILLLLIVVGFGAFLYAIPPFFIVAPETLARPINDSAPTVADIQDPAERAIAERGRYLVVAGGCMGCHQTPGPQGPDLGRYDAGGMLFKTRDGVYLTRNLTPDKETGLARRTDDEVKRVLLSGVFPDGHVAPYRLMPWGSYTNWTEEDRHAVVVYLRHLKPVAHAIAAPKPAAALSDPNAIEEVYAGADYSTAR